MIIVSLKGEFFRMERPKDRLFANYVAKDY